MIEVPHTYSEWVDLLSILKSKTDDDEVLLAMQNGTIEWQTGVAERFSKKLIDTVNYRINAASDRFQLELSRAGNQEGAIVRSLLSLRKEMTFLTKVINIPALPEKKRQYFINLVVEQADVMQKSLEDSAKSERSGKLSSIVRNHKINVF